MRRHQLPRGGHDGRARQGAYKRPLRCQRISSKISRALNLRLRQQHTMYAFESTMRPTEPFSPIHSQRAKSFSRLINDRLAVEQYMPPRPLSTTMEEEENVGGYSVGEDDETPMDPSSPTIEIPREPSPTPMDLPASSRPFPTILNQKMPSAPFSPGMGRQPAADQFDEGTGGQTWTTTEPFSPKIDDEPPTSKPLSPRMSEKAEQRMNENPSPRTSEKSPGQFSPVVLSPRATSNPSASRFSLVVEDLAPSGGPFSTAPDEPRPVRPSLASMEEPQPPKPFSANKDEESWIPASMRALYYSVSPAIHNAIANGLSEGIDSAETDISGAPAPTPYTGLILDTRFPTPQPSASEYLLKVQTAAFCQDELRLAAELNPAKTTPQIPLHSICGTVISTPTQDHGRPFGPRFKISDVVFGVLSYTRDGGAADYVVATEGEVTLKPKSINSSEAAALALPALTAWQALFRYAGLDPDAPHAHWRENGNGYSSGSGSGSGIGVGTKNKHGSSNGSGHGYGYGWRRKSIDFINAHSFKPNKSGSGNGPSRSSTTNSSATGSENGSGSSQGWRRKSMDFLNGHAFNNGNGFRKKSTTLRVMVTNARDNEVGRIAVQLLRAEKLFSQTARPWICVTCTPAEEQAIRQGWDVDEVLVIPHLPTQSECDLGTMFWERRLQPVDFVLDCTGGVVFQQAHSPAVVKDHGAVLTAVDPQPALGSAVVDQQEAQRRRKRGIRSRFVPVNPDSAALARIVELVDDNTVRGNEEQVVDLVNASKLLEGKASAVAGYRRGAMMVVRVN